MTTENGAIHIELKVDAKDFMLKEPKTATPKPERCPECGQYIK